ncbi:MAG TPA: BatA domain-containing protein, partial [Acidobacteriota bacterium]|nr:BatA domain-containing protein [Acidobacteriota bacterium]
MRFGANEWLWALTAVPVLWALLVWTGRRRRRMAARFADASSWSRLTGGLVPGTRLGKHILILTGAVLLVLAVARPQWGARAVMLQRRGL